MMTSNDLLGSREIRKESHTGGARFLDSYQAAEKVTEVGMRDVPPCLLEQGPRKTNTNEYPHNAP